MLPFAAVWAAFDVGLLGAAVADAGLFLLPFLLLHMMPVWMYLSGVVFCFLKYRRTGYLVTDHGVYVAGGVFSVQLETKTFAELSRVNLHRGVFDQMFQVGDVLLTTDQLTRKGTPAVLAIASIPDYETVFRLVQRLQRDIYADTQYPNDLRPEENHGYRTKYRG